MRTAVAGMPLVVVGVGMAAVLASSSLLTTAFNVQSRLPRRVKLSSPVLFSSYLDSLSSSPPESAVPADSTVDNVARQQPIPEGLPQQQQAEAEIVANHNGGYLIHDAIHSMKQSHTGPHNVYAPSGFKPLRTGMYNNAKNE